MARMTERKRQTSRTKKINRPVPAVSTVLSSGAIVEQVYNPHSRRTAFSLWQNDHWTLTDRIDDGDRTLVPYAADNNLMRHNVVLFPSEPEEYGSQADLMADVTAFVRRYVDVSADFERFATAYVLFTWLYDAFNELPYLRLKGNYGTGKTRFLQIVGSVCYRPIFANGASTVSPIFHMVDLFGGTLVFDEADFRFSNEKADMVKIFNNGNVRGIPVLRSQITKEREFDPRVFQVFGPKVVAMRGDYDDPALESRFITEETSQRELRDDIPINLPPTYQAEALTLRNKLLMFRFRSRNRHLPVNELVDRTTEPRTNQILAPLFSIIEDEKVRTKLQKSAQQYCSAIARDTCSDFDDYRWEPCG